MKTIFFEKGVMDNNVLMINLDRVPGKGEKVFIDGREYRVNNISTDIETHPAMSVIYRVHIYKPQSEI